MMFFAAETITLSFETWINEMVQSFLMIGVPAVLALSVAAGMIYVMARIVLADPVTSVRAKSQINENTRADDAWDEAAITVARHDAAQAGWDQ